MKQTLSRKQTLIVVILLAAVLSGMLYRSRTERHKHHDEIIALISELAKRQHNQQEVRELLRQAQFRDLALREGESKDWVVETPIEFGATNWVLHLTMSDSKVAAMRVRTSDSSTIHPSEAPPDIEVMR